MFRAEHGPSWIVLVVIGNNFDPAALIANPEPTLRIYPIRPNPASFKARSAPSRGITRQRREHADANRLSRR
jgi:hypothetical protein